MDEIIKEWFSNPEIKWTQSIPRDIDRNVKSTTTKHNREYIPIDKICTDNSERFRDFIHSLLKHDVRFKTTLVDNLMIKEYHLGCLHWRGVFRDNDPIIYEIPYIAVNKNSNTSELAYLPNDTYAALMFPTETYNIYRLRNPFHRMFRLEEFL